MIEIKENELYQEIELFRDGVKIGKAEIDIKGKMISELNIFPKYLDMGYGEEVVEYLNRKYGCNSIWVNAYKKRGCHKMKDSSTFYTEATV